MGLRSDARAALAVALPIMLGYLAIGVPCGVMSSEIGLAPWMAFLLSVTFYSGAGQFMMSSLWLQGTPLVSLILSVSLVSTRQMLYSAAFSTHAAEARRPLAALFAATVTDESFGVNLERFLSDGSWSVRRATLVNLMSMLSWGVANAVGCAVGAVLAIPTAIMSFAMTSIFVCLLVGQPKDLTVGIVVLATAVSVAVLKLAGAGSVAVLFGALAGVGAGLVAGAVRRGGEAA